jgi:hypothetical protein
MSHMYRFTLTFFKRDQFTIKLNSPSYEKNGYMRGRIGSIILLHTFRKNVYHSKGKPEYSHLFLFLSNKRINFDR